MLFAAALAAVSLFLLAGGSKWLSLEALQDARVRLAESVDEQPLRSALLFMAVYVGVVALSLPGAAIMTLAGGALFGLVRGVLLVSISATIGATLAMLMARFIARDWVRRRFPDAVGAVDRGMAKGGDFYHLSLRLAPVFPFFLVNLAMGLTLVSVGRYAVVTMAGALPGTIAYVAAGTALSRVREVGDVLSPGLLGALLLLAVMPLIGRGFAGWLTRRKALRGFRSPARFDANLIVIGAGSAGLVGSLVAAELKSRVVLIERGAMGGDCLNTGCVPSKSLIRAARAAADARSAGRFGVVCDSPRVDFPAVVRHIRHAIAEIAPNDSVERYRSLGVDVRQASARLVDPWTVELDSGERLTGKAILLATGADPVVPPIPGLADSGFVTSETLWDRLEQFAEVPERVVVLGGGPIGCELAQAMARLGSSVALVEQADRVLARESADASERVQSALRTDGVELVLGEAAERVRDGVLHTASKALPFDLLIVALGRRPSFTGLRLEALGLSPDQLVADPRGQGAFGHIFLAGDAAGGPQFTHFAGHGGAIAAINALLGAFGRLKTDTVVPRVTYTAPEVASVGLSGDDAPDGSEVVRFDVAHNDRDITDGGPGGFVRLVVRNGRVLGVTIVADHAGELITPWIMAIKRKIKLSAMLSLIYPYPTLSEISRGAAGEWRKAHRPEGLLRWAERFHTWRRS